MAVELDESKFPFLLARVEFMGGESIRQIAKGNRIPEKEVEDALREDISRLLTAVHTDHYASKEEENCS
tara:strand:+ start:375 stop:581 length:207 start_codon:yes stop_codon:yes gene_type:complete